MASSFFSSSEIETMDSFEGKSVIEFKGLELASVDIETQETTYKATLNGTMSDISSNYQYQSNYALSVATSDGQTASISFSQLNSEESNESKVSFIGSNGKSYQFMYNGDEYVFEPTFGYVGLYNREGGACYENSEESPEEMPMAISEEQIPSSTLVGYDAIITLIDEQENRLVVTYGNEEGWTMEPISVELNPEQVVDAPLEEF